MNAHFMIRKWYLDCISESGDAVIVYSAELSWRGLVVHYSSFIATRNDVITTHTAMAECAPQPLDAETVSVDTPRLRLAGTWKQRSAPIERSLLESPDGFVHWDCMHPKADACVQIAGLGEVIGLGYVECLTMTIPPWRLPMSQLRWGRFLSPEDSVVWIDWQGSHQVHLTLHNGIAPETSQIADNELAFDQHLLTLDRGLTLRSGTLGETILPAAPALRNLLPGSLFKIEEHKWRSRGTMASPGQPHRFGWAIHEVVRWNQ